MKEDKTVEDQVFPSTRVFPQAVPSAKTPLITVLISLIAAIASLTFMSSNLAIASFISGNFY